jgi:hypothetical protein
MPAVLNVLLQCKLPKLWSSAPSSGKLSIMHYQKYEFDKILFHSLTFQLRLSGLMFLQVCALPGGKNNMAHREKKWDKFKVISTR